MSVIAIATTSPYINFGAVSSVQNLSLRSILVWVSLITPPTVPNNSAAMLVHGAPTVAGTDEEWDIRIQTGVSHDPHIRFRAGWSVQYGVWQAVGSISSGLCLIAVTYDRSAAGNTPKLYMVSGGSLSTFTVTTVSGASGAYLTGLNSALHVGQDIATDFTMAFQDVRIYSRILSSSEILAIGSNGHTLEMNDYQMPFHAPLLFATGIPEANRPFSDTLAAANKFYDRIAGVVGSPVTAGVNLVGYRDLAYSTGF